MNIDHEENLNRTARMTVAVDSLDRHLSHLEEVREVLAQIADGSVTSAELTADSTAGQLTLTIQWIRNTRDLLAKGGDSVL